jgi:transposase
VIGYDESEQLDVEPARYFVRVTKREKRACRHCSSVTAAPLWVARISRRDPKLWAHWQMGVRRGSMAGAV